MSNKKGKPVITLHYKNKCHMVDNVICHVPTWGHVNKSQPRFVVKGKSSNIEIKDDIAHIF